MFLFAKGVTKTRQQETTNISGGGGGGKNKHLHFANVCSPGAFPKQIHREFWSHENKSFDQTNTLALATQWRATDIFGGGSCGMSLRSIGVTLGCVRRESLGGYLSRISVCWGSFRISLQLFGGNAFSCKTTVCVCWLSGFYPHCFRSLPEYRVRAGRIKCVGAGCIPCSRFLFRRPILQLVEGRGILVDFDFSGPN